jgi:predicted deacylase
MATDKHTASTTVDRIIGSYGDDASGVMVVAVAGLHGNEKSGIVASRRILDVLNSTRPRAAGRFIAVAGNLKALQQNVRFVDSDLNRIWRAKEVLRRRESDPSEDNSEEAEQRELLGVLDDLLTGHRGPVAIVDLHSTSALAPPFCIISDTLQNREVAFELGVPVILGLEEAIRGTIQEFFGERGFITLAIEGGQHEAPDTVARLESALWLTLQATRVVHADDIPDLTEHRRRLEAVSKGLPSVVEVFFRYGLAPDDGFRMRDGFRNFSPVRRGDPVAMDHRGEILAPEDGMLILPRYQGIGDDGFFMGRHVRLFWLRLSALLRRARVDRALHLMPGVRRDTADPRVLYADPRVARWLTLQIFHLAGYRKCPSHNGMMVFKRRVEHGG